MEAELRQHQFKNPEAQMIRDQAWELYCEYGCSACSSFDIKRDPPCFKLLEPGENWCHGFEERA